MTPRTPPTKFELMRRNRPRFSTALDRERLREVREAGWDVSGDPELAAVEESMARRREMQIQMVTSPWWHSVMFWKRGPA